MTVTHEMKELPPAPASPPRVMTDADQLERLRSRIRTIAAVTAIFAIFTALFWKQVANSNDLAPAPPADSISSLQEPATTSIEPASNAAGELNRPRDPSMLEWLLLRAIAGDDQAQPLIERVRYASLRTDGVTLDVRTTINPDRPVREPVFAGEISDAQVAIRACNAGVDFAQTYYLHPGAVVVHDATGDVVAGRVDDRDICHLHWQG